MVNLDKEEKDQKEKAFETTFWGWVITVFIITVVMMGLLGTLTYCGC